ncbi:hypothetical protein AK830_g2101 [Neonectria ditissima]|uniref:EXPERA domain-containing protein n=1 Tax=Neonectria ditissima TaxID=78410 RepID=A0A0P7BSP0_9HYPO|nr:hypothetical protein AK830_g2101 [Neonectria ditissima]
MATNASTHPYYPLGVDIPDYTANTLSTPAIFAIFATACSGALLPALVIIRRARPNISNGELATAMWFVLCGCIHLVLEGNFAVYHAGIPSGSNVLSQLWKEYSLSDSRYLTRDAFMVSMESVTAFAWGPLSFLLVYLIVTAHPARHFLQTVISVGQIYGDILYYATFFHEDVVRGIEFSRPERYYFYGYMVLMNAFWIVIPSLLLAQSGMATMAAFAKAGKVAKRD